MGKTKKRKIKRHVSTEEKKTDRKVQIVILGIVALIVMGFTLTAFITPKYGGSGGNEEEEIIELDYLTATSKDTRSGDLFSETDIFGIFGEIADVYRLEKRIGGDLILLEGGVSGLLIGKFDEEDLARRSGTTILYSKSLCLHGNETFDCFVTEGLFEGNTTPLFDSFGIVGDSEYLEDNVFGFPNNAFV
jgi:hypothetical protein